MSLVSLHPLVLLNIGDQLTRGRNNNSTNISAGVLLGKNINEKMEVKKHSFLKISKTQVPKIRKLI